MGHRIPPHRHYYTNTRSLNHSQKVGRTHGLMLFTQISNRAIQMLQQKSTLIKLGNVFAIFYCPVSVSLCDLYPQFSVQYSAVVSHRLSSEMTICLSCNEWLSPHSPPTFDINKAFSPIDCRLTSPNVSVNTRDACVGKSQQDSSS